MSYASSLMLRPALIWRTLVSLSTSSLTGMSREAFIAIFVGDVVMVEISSDGGTGASLRPLSRHSGLLTPFASTSLHPRRLASHRLVPLAQTQSSPVPGG
jgi:hypothetical protein